MKRKPLLLPPEIHPEINPHFALILWNKGTEARGKYSKNGKYTDFYHTYILNMRMDLFIFQIEIYRLRHSGWTNTYKSCLNESCFKCILFRMFEGLNCNILLQLTDIGTIRSILGGKAERLSICVVFVLKENTVENFIPDFVASEMNDGFVHIRE